MTRRLWDFDGGLHLPGEKGISVRQPVAAMPVPATLMLPLHQHIGEPAEPVVEVGEKVYKGQLVAHAEGYVSAPVHASSSGTVVAIEDRPVPHPSALSAPCIVIETDGEDAVAEDAPEGVADYTQLDPSALRNLIRDAGIVGLGGAGFPSFIKLNPGPRTEVETLVLNGAECEPYITCDDMLMRERADEVIAGARIMRHALHARHCVIGIEDNKPEAYAALREMLERDAHADIELVQVPTRYPTGGEKQLIKVLTGKEVPSQGLPIDVGIVCHNVTTAASVYRAVVRGEALYSRIVTVTGRGIASAQNVEVRLGTPVAEILDFCGGTTVDLQRVIIGGPMMGFDLADTKAPVVKTTGCILAATGSDLSLPREPVRPCIRCGACTEVCPARLLPQQIYWHARAKDFDKAQDYNLFDCIECGCCSYVCPSNLPLVHFYRYAKTEIWSQEREKRKADLARQRHEFRQARQEREKAEREAKKKKAAAAKKKEAGEEKGGEEKEGKKEAIKAAMERAKAKKAQAQPKNTENLTEEQKRKIAEAEARRATRRKQTEPADGDDDEGKDE